jgi:hypothetical protein
MLMRKSFRRRSWDPRDLREQPDLFRPMPQRPVWGMLPKEIRQKALQLLARLMNTAHDRNGAAAKEVSDE